MPSRISKNGLCNKEFPIYNRAEVIRHFIVFHQANISFVIDEDIKKMLEFKYTEGKEND